MAAYRLFVRFVRFGVGGVLAVALVAWSVFPALPGVFYAPLMVSAGAARTVMAFAPAAMPDGTRLASIGHGAAPAPVSVNGPGAPDPYLQPQVLLNSPPQAGEAFGSAVSFSADGNTLAVGAPGTNVVGAVQVFTRSGGGSYTLVATIPDPNLMALSTEYFGSAVSLSGDGGTLAVGAHGTNFKGAAYVYTLSGGIPTSTIAFADPAPPSMSSDAFGAAVSLNTNGSVLAVGAYGTSSSQGAAYTYTKNGVNYAAPQTIPHPGAMNNDQFGATLSLSGSGGTLAVGAIGTSSYQGAVYTYAKSVGIYSLSQTLIDPAVPSITNKGFGVAVALSTDGSTLAVGETLTSNKYPGTAHIYHLNMTSYGSPQTLPDPNATGSGFGSALALSTDGSTLAVAMPFNMSNTGKSFVGVAYEYSRNNGSHTIVATRNVTTPNGGELFGSAVSLSADGSMLAVGAPGTNSSTGEVDVFSPVPAVTPLNGTSPQSTTVNTAFATTLQADVRDRFGNAVSGTTVTFTAPTPVSGATGTFTGVLSTVTAVSDVNGIATPPAFTANTTSGTYNVSASVPVTGGGTVTTNFTVTNVGGVATGLTVTAGNNQSATVNTAFATPLQVTVHDTYGNLTSGNVTFTAPPSGASGIFTGGLSTLTVASDANGIAAAPAFTANTTSGTYNVSTSMPVTGGGTVTANFSLTNTAGTAVSFAIAAGNNQSAAVGAVFAIPPQAQLRDIYSNPVSGASVTFIVSGSGASGTFPGNMPTTTVPTVTVLSDATGKATTPAFTANATSGNYTMNATAMTTSGTTNIVFSLTNTATASAHITVFDGANQSAVLGVQFAAPLQAVVRDAHGNPASGVTITFAAPVMGATVTFPTGNTAITDSNGVGGVSVTASGRPGNLTVTANVMGVSGPASFGLTNTPAANTLTITSFAPSTGPIAGGTAVTIHGTNFAAPATVTFGGVAGTSVIVTNATTLTVITPAVAVAATVDIAVTVGMQKTTTHGYTYLGPGGIMPQPQPGGHPVPGSGPLTPMVQPARR